MTELTKDDIKDAVREAMAEKFEVTFGINCLAPEEREAVREDMKFLRALRQGARSGGERLFWGLWGLLGTAAFSFFWPDIQKWLKGG